MSHINENSFFRWLIEKSDGLITLGLQKLSESVRDYAYLILTSQTSTRGQIVGIESRNLDAQRTFLNSFKNIVNRRVNIPEDIEGFKRLCNMLGVKWIMRSANSYTCFRAI